MPGREMRAAVSGGSPAAQSVTASSTKPVGAEKTIQRPERLLSPFDTIIRSSLRPAKQ